MHLFFGDAHFGNRYSNREEERIGIFLDFLNKQVDHARTVFIIGDLFEFWFEYHSVIPKQYYPILNGLSKFVDKGINVNYFMGNHEFGNGDFFKSLGFHVYFDETIFQLDKLKVLVGHGDKADDAAATQFMNFLFRSRFNQFLYQLVHPDLGIGLAKAVARASREKTKLHDSSIKLENYAFKKLNEKDADIVIFGHSHMPVLKNYNGRYYLNVGDFLEHFTYGVIDQGRVFLKTIK